MLVHARTEVSLKVNQFRNTTAQNLRLKVLKFKLRLTLCHVILNLRCCTEHCCQKRQEFIDSLVNHSPPSFIANPPFGNIKPVSLTVALGVLFNIPATKKMRHFGPYNAAEMMKSAGLVNRTSRICLESAQVSRHTYPPLNVSEMLAL